MKRSPIARKATLKRRSAWLKRTTPLRKSGATKAKKVKRQRAYYSSSVWKAKRIAALERADWQCEFFVPLPRTDDELRCPETFGLQVHHKTNARFGGDERPEDLIVYCKAHHAFIEARDSPHRQHR